MFTPKVRAGLLFSAILAFIVIVATALYGDVPRTGAALAHFRWPYLALMLGLVLFNYLWRFVKWQYYLRCLEIHIHWRESLLIFLSGLSMAITPGKVGELLKSYLLKRSTGAAVSRTSPVIVAERLTDSIAMLGLAATGLVLYRLGWQWLIVLLISGLVCIVLMQNRPLALSLLNRGARLPLVSRSAHLLREFYESSYSLLQWRILLLAVLISFVSWAGECGAFYFVFVGLGMEPGLALLTKATMILAVSSLVGVASGLPGGLGTAEGSMLGLTRLLISPSATVGGAATLLIRFCTLWFGLGIGVIALFIFRSTQPANFSRERGNEWEEQQPEGASHLQELTDSLPLPAPFQHSQNVMGSIEKEL